MNLDLIGEENLPNVYIESVDINPLYNSGKSRKDMGAELEVRFKVFDGLSRRGIPYFSDFKNHPKKQIMLILSKDPQFTETLTNLGGKIDPKTLRSLEGYDSRKVQFELFSARKVKLNRKEETEIFYQTKMKLSTKDEHAAIFACVIKSYRDFYDNGPVTSELVILEGETVKKAFYFVDSVTRQVWNGPVHMHPNGGFMGGSFHTSEPHPRLNRIEIPNLKIRDNRIKSTQLDVSKKLYKQPKEELKNYHFGPLMSSQADNGAFNFLFNLDVYQIMKDYSANKKLSLVNDDLFYRLTSTSKIKQIEIYYNTMSDKTFKLISKSKDLNGVVETIYTDNFDNNLKYMRRREDAAGKIEAIIEELVLNREVELKTFNCQINKKHIYQIKVKVVIKDPLRNYLQQLKTKTERALSSLKSYHNRLKKPVNYDRARSKTTQVFKRRYSRQTRMWYDPIRVFEEIIGINSKIDQKEKEDLIRNMFFMLSPKTLSINSCEKAIRIFSKEYERFVKLFDLRKTMRLGKGRANAKSNLQKNEVTIDKIYTVSFMRNHRMLDLMPTPDLDKQIPLMRVSQIFNTLTNEANRYQVNLSGQEGLQNRERDIFYVGPKRIAIKGNNYNISNLNSIDEKQISKIVNDSTRLLDLDLGSSRLLVQKYKNKEEEKVDPVRQMGEDSPFQQNLDKKDKQRIALDIPKNKKKLLNFSRNKVKGSKVNKQLFSFKSKKNILTARTPSQIDLVPVHLKDLTVKEEVFGMPKNEFFDKEPYKRSLLFENLYKINLLSEIQDDSKFRKPLNNRRSLDTTSRRLRRIEEPSYCILNKYVENNIVEEDNEFRKFSPVNTVFIAVPDDWDFTREINVDAPLSSELPSLYEEMLNNLELEESFLRTNLVRQEKDRQTVIVRKRATNRPSRPTRPKNARTEKTKTEPQRKQEKEEIIKKMESEKRKPLRKPRKPSREENRRKLLRKNKEETPQRTRRQPRQRTQTRSNNQNRVTRAQPTRRTNRTGRRRGY